MAATVVASATATIVPINEERTRLLRGTMSEFARAEHTGRVVHLTAPTANWLSIHGRHREQPLSAELKLYNTLQSAFYTERPLHYLVCEVACVACDAIPVVVRLDQ